MRAHVVGTSVLLVVVATAARAGELTVQEALEQASAANEAVLAARAGVAEKEQARMATGALSWPRVGLSGEYVQLDDPVVLDLDPIRAVILALHPNVPASAVPHFRETLLDDTLLRTNLHGTWPLYTGGKITAARHAAAAGVEVARAETREIEGRTVTDVVRRYYALRLATAALDVRTQVLADMDEHLRQARRLEEEGLIARAERLHAEVGRAEAARQCARAGRDVELARIALSSVLASDDEAVAATSPLFVLTAPPSLDELHGAVADANPTLARVAAQRELAAAGTRAARAAYLPQVFAFGMRQLRTADLMPIEPRWAVGVGVTLDVFDGFEREHSVAAARAREQRVALLDRRVSRDLATLLDTRYRKLLSAADQVSALATTRALAEENVRVRTIAFAEGFATSLDVVDASLALEKVRMERLLAAYDYVCALAEALEVAGQGQRFPELAARADVEVER